MLWCCVHQRDAALFTPLRYRYLRRVTLELHTLFLSHLRVLMMDGWRMAQWISPPPTFSNRHFKKGPVSFGSQINMVRSSRSCNLHLKAVPLTCLMPAIHWKVHLHSDPENAQTQNAQNFSEKGNQGSWNILDLTAVIACNCTKWHVGVKITELVEENRARLGQNLSSHLSDIMHPSQRFGGRLQSSLTQNERY